MDVNDILVIVFDDMGSEIDVILDVDQGEEFDSVEDMGVIFEDDMIFE